MSDFTWSYSSLKQYQNCPKQYYEIKVAENIFQCNLAIRKKHFHAVGGYPETENSTLDQELYSKLKII